jgi:hypothetical protein
MGKPVPDGAAGEICQVFEKLVGIMHTEMKVAQGVLAGVDLKGFAHLQHDGDLRAGTEVAANVATTIVPDKNPVRGA